MAEEIVQRLGLDASDALNQLRSLTSVTDSYAQSVSSLVRSLDSFNGTSNATIANMRNIGSAVSDLTRAYQDLASAQANANRGRGGGPGGGQPPGPNPQQIREQAQQIAESVAGGLNIPSRATEENRRKILSMAGALGEVAARSQASLADIQRIANDLGGVYTGAERRIADTISRINTSVTRLSQAGAQINPADMAARVQRLAEVISNSFQIPKSATDQQKQALNAAAANIADLAAKSGISFRRIREIGANLGGVYTGAEKRIAGELSKVQKTLRDTASVAQTASQSIVVSWGTALKIFAVQSIQRALASLRAGFQQALSSAIEFETQLAQILTIAPTLATKVGTAFIGVDQSLNRARDAVRGLSEEFARPIDDVANAFYGILSNQIGEASDSALVLRQSLILSTAAVSSAEDAANALSSIINSYGLNASDAAEITDKLFKAVDVGRFTLDQIANSIGRVTGLGAELGVSIDEILAGLATLTINGIDSDEAMTLLSNAMRGLLKPTEKMRAAFDALGVSSAEAGIAAYGGLQPFLEALRKQAGDTASEVTQLTDNIRTGRGVFGITGKAAEQYAQSLREIRDESAGTAQAAANLIIETNAQQVQRDLTALRNFFVDDLARNALPVILEISRTFGGLVNILKSVAVAAGLVGTIFAGFKLYTTYIAAAATASEALKVQQSFAALSTAATATATNGLAGATTRAAVAARALGAAMLTIPGAIIITALTAAVIAYSQSLKKVDFDSFNKRIDDSFKAASESAQAAADAQTAIFKEELKAREQSARANVAVALNTVRELNILYKQDVENAKEAQKEILNNVQDQAKERVKLQGDLVRHLEGISKDAAKTIKEANADIGDLKLTEDERVFDRQIRKLDDVTKATRELRRATDLRNRTQGQGLIINEFVNSNKSLTAKDFLKDKDLAATTQEEIKSQQELLKLARSRAEAAQQVGDATKNIALQANAEKELVAIHEREIALKNRSIEITKQQKAAAEQLLAVEKKRQFDAQKILKNIEKFQVVSKDTTKSFASREEARAQAEALADEFTTVLSEGRDLSLDEFLGIQDLRSRITADFRDPLNNSVVSFKTAFSSAIDEVFAKLTKTVDANKEAIKELENLTGRKFNVQVGFDEITDELVKSLNSLVEALNRQAGLPQLKKDVETANKEIGGIVDKLAGAQAQSVDARLGGKPFIAQATLAATPGAPAFLAQAGEQNANNILKEREALLKRIAIANTALVEQGKTAPLLNLQQELALGAQKLTQQAKEVDNNELLKKKLTEEATLTAQLSTVVGELVRKQTELGRVKAETPENKEAEAKAKEAAARLATTEQKLRETREAAEAAALAANGTGAALTDTGTKSTAAADIVIANEKRKQAEIEKTNALIGKGWSFPASATQGAVPQAKASGGRVRYFSNGGFVPKGTDTQPAMLTPDEFVVNARSSRMFASELRAINSGRAPVYRAEGGPVTTNYNIGDVVVNNSGGGRVQGREIAAELDRELRRRTSRLRR